MRCGGDTCPLTFWNKNIHIISIYFIFQIIAQIIACHQFAVTIHVLVIASALELAVRLHRTMARSTTQLFRGAPGRRTCISQHGLPRGSPTDSEMHFDTTSISCIWLQLRNWKQGCKTVIQTYNDIDTCKNVKRIRQRNWQDMKCSMPPKPWLVEKLQKETWTDKRPYIFTLAETQSVKGQTLPLLLALWPLKVLENLPVRLDPRFASFPPDRHWVIRGVSHTGHDRSNGCHLIHTIQLEGRVRRLVNWIPSLGIRCKLFLFWVTFFASSYHLGRGLANICLLRPWV